ncbi:MAG: hypothetical protein ACKOX6_15895 [Bdellovibrio sp.]
MKRKLFEFLLILIMLTIMVLLAASMGGCATKPPDFKMCVEMNLERGECMKVISGQKIRIDEDHKNPDTKQSWWEMRPTNLILPLESWLDIKKFIINLCHQNQNMCDKEVASWDRSLQNVDQDLAAKGVTVPQQAPEPSPNTNTPDSNDSYYNP